MSEPTPHVWLWGELARLLGKEQALELYEGYTARNRQYNRDRRVNAGQRKPVQKRTQIKRQLLKGKESDETI